MDEQGYIEHVKSILTDGVERRDRTSVGSSLVKFGHMGRYNLRRGFPLFTTKRVFWRAVAEELIWFLKGCTDGVKLAEKGVNIWRDNGTRSFLDSRGLTDHREHDLGPVYGFQWRHWGASYVGADAEYSGQGHDQIQSILSNLKARNNNRRLLLSAWNVSDVPKMALPPCHLFAQFHIDFPAGYQHGTITETIKPRLSCLFYQRSADMGLGVPFNVASYALLTHIMAHLADLEVGELIHSIGDAHIYTNHVAQLELQVKREIRPPPQLTINPRVKSLEDLTFEDLTITGYNPHPTIKMEMAV
ncbi:thymidylate synthase [Anguillid herpesvirus 1]|uniref:thymidylate synthase n=1 Tax=Anguillid herpesvirus 1 TaxID=150286 RepID=A0A1J0REG4_9VIRU|nr:thymidylate synthase [Anguillid herpesvirus 1]ADA57838.1 thymidylate synthase [Anguillid herpesvirus 1]APD76237.1 thymidylate synthase [Anguillid herpesvirus 1]QRM16368.1 thymidylate synthase [Anguillid herpesvirus 1]QRM16497.1 thymidylate synthase [Anguillid herpesvirus 1]QRM16627.1 thymidylate synthase [Anguillid herpesvirus 1]